MEQNRLLIVDDNEAIHNDFIKILGSKEVSSEMNDIQALLFGETKESNSMINVPIFKIDSAFQGEQGLEYVREANLNNEPYALAFVDVRMPPGWDGIYTIEKLWEVDPNLQVVICTAYSDQSFDEIYHRLKGSDNFLILKKPFDIIEIRQLASTLTKKWELSRQTRQHIDRQRTQIERFSNESEFLFHLSKLSQTELELPSALQFFIGGLCKLQAWPIGHACNLEKNQESDHDLTEAFIHIWYVEDNSLYQKTQTLINQKGSKLIDRVLETRQECWLNDHEEKSYLNPMIQDGFAIPIKRYDKIIAVAEFFSENPIEKSQNFLDFISTASNQLGTLLEKKQNEKELKKNYGELKSLYQELQSTQTQLVQHSKLIAIGQLAAGIAHEINNPIAFVASNTRSLQKYMSTIQEVLTEIDDQITLMDSSGVTQLQERWMNLNNEKNLSFIREDIDMLLKECLDGLDRVKEIVTDLKTFSHTDEGEMQEADINNCIDITLKMIWNELKYKCNVKKEYSELPKIFCNPRQLNQVFMNLLVNAVQAIPEKGEITIKTTMEKGMVQIAIQDSGEGIAPDHIEKLFDPFFTTKPVGTGTGLGLSISYNIIQKHKGRIEVNSKLGVGTTFSIYLPIREVELPNENQHLEEN